MNELCEYDNIMSLAKKANYKKIMIMRNSWGPGSWAIVNGISLRPDGIYGSAYGHIHYSDGSKVNGSIPCAGTYAWRIIKILEDDMTVDYQQ